MARPKGSKNRKPPKYSRHDSGRPFVRINERPVYLGTAEEYDSPQSWGRYYAVLAQNNMRGGQGVDNRQFDKTVTELVAGRWEWIQAKSGLSKSSIGRHKIVLRVLDEMYGPTCASDFTPLDYQAIRDRLVTVGTGRKSPIGRKQGKVKDIATLCRKTINGYMILVYVTFKWGQSCNMVRPGVAATLLDVESLTKRELGKRDYPERLPVAQNHINVIMPHLSSTEQAIISILSLTAARVGEICIMRKIDIDTSNPDRWIYTPERHKTDYMEDSENFARIIPLDSEAQRILEPYLGGKPEDYLFTPERSRLEHWRRRRGELLTRVIEGIEERFGYSSEFSSADVGEIGAAAKVPGHGKLGVKASKHTVLAWLAYLRRDGTIVQTSGRLNERRYTLVPLASRIPIADDGTRWGKCLEKSVKRMLHRRCFHPRTLWVAIQEAIKRVNRQTIAAHEASGAEGDARTFPRWTTHQIRHAVLTWVDNKYGPLAASSLAGHRSQNTTKIYTRTARDAMFKLIDEIQAARRQSETAFPVMRIA